MHVCLHVYTHTHTHTQTHISIVNRCVCLREYVDTVCVYHCVRVCVCTQVYDRAARMGLQDCETLFVLAESRMDVILAQALQTRPAALVVDSLQTMYLPDLDNGSGQVVQVGTHARARARVRAVVAGMCITYRRTHAHARAPCKLCICLIWLMHRDRWCRWLDARTHTHTHTRAHTRAHTHQVF